MSYLQNGIAILLVVAGLTSMLIGSIGIIRLPDFFTRSHASSMVDTAGIICLLAGFTVYQGLTLTTGKLFLAILFVAMTNPVGIHILGKAALRSGLRPWHRNEENEKGGES